MYAGFVYLTKKPLATLTGLQKKYIALKYSGGDTWKKIGTSFKPLMEYADKFVLAQKEQSFRGQEGYSSLFPKPSAVGMATAEFAQSLADAAKKYYNAHKDPTSWLPANKKAEKARADLTNEILDAALKLVTAAKKVKDEKFVAPSIETNEEFVKARQGFAKLAKETAETFKGYLGQAQGFQKEGVGALSKAQQLSEKVAQEHQTFKNDPIFLKSRGSMPEFPDEVAPETETKLRKDAQVAFEAGMRSAALLSKYQEEIDQILQELKGLAEEAGYDSLNAEAVVKKLEEVKKEFSGVMKTKVSKMAKFEWDSVKAALTKMAETYQQNPEKAKAYKLGYTNKRDEIAERMEAAKVAIGSFTAMKKRVGKLPAPTTEVGTAKSTLLTEIDVGLELPTKYYAAAEKFKTLVSELNPRVGEG